MKTIKSAVKTRLASVSVLVLVCLLVPVSSKAQINNPQGNPRQPVQFVPGVPQVVNPAENEFQRESHYLSFLGSYIPESPNSATAYYAAIDPLDSNGLDPKARFPQWLKNAGFIGQESDWNPSGPQLFACDQPGCNYPRLNPDGTPRYGPNIINTDSHAIVLNAADLGFVRNQFIRCVDPANAKSTNPCSAPNPKIYTYLENYPVNPFSGKVVGTTPPFTCSGPSGGVVESVASCFPTLSGYPTDPEVTAAIQSAISRPFGTVVDPNSGKLSPIKTARIADVAFEWAPPVGNPNSSTRFGQLYAYQVGNDASGKITETLNYAPNFNGAHIVDFQAGGFNQLTINAATDKFAPNLDGVGFKQHPGVCLVCHGGAPAFVPTGGPYPRAGNINGFRFLPLDNANLLFPTAAFPVTAALPAGFTHDFTLGAQERQIREYNIAVLKTVPTYAENDGTGAVRVPHLREVIEGWYGGPGLPNSTQNSNFIPVGWREAPNGPAPAGSGAEELYKQVVGPSCRSCHFNRELSLDFGTYANFHQESDLQQLSFLGSCKQNNDADPNAKFMPLALLTFVRFWETQNGVPHTLTGGTTLSNEVDRLAKDFGFGSVQGYCNTHP